EVGAKVARLLLRQNMRLEKAKRNWDKFDEALTTAARAVPGSTEVTLLRVQALLARQQNAEAEALIQKSCKEQPAKLDLWLAWAMFTHARAISRRRSAFGALRPRSYPRMCRSA